MGEKIALSNVIEIIVIDTLLKATSQFSYDDCPEGGASSLSKKPGFGLHVIGNNCKKSRNLN
jgi:hypothetical protein